MKVSEISDRLRLGLDSLRIGLADFRTQLLARRAVLQIRDDGLRGLVLGRAPAPIELPLPPGSCREGVPREIDAIGDLIGDLFLERGLSGAELAACLPPLACRWKVVRWPYGVIPENGRAEVRLRAPDLGIGWSLSEVYLEAEPLPGTPARSLVAAAPQAVVDGWAEVFDLAGVRLQRLLPAQVCEWRALTNLVLTPDGGAGGDEGVEHWLLDLAASHTRLWVMVAGVPLADWTFAGPRRTGAGLTPALGQWLQQCRQFWRRHQAGAAVEQWWLYGDDARITAAEPAVRDLVSPGAVQLLTPDRLLEGAGTDRDLPLMGLQQEMGWS